MKNMKIRRFVQGFLAAILACGGATAQTADYAFDLSGEAKEGCIGVAPDTRYGGSTAYGYDLGTVQDGNRPFFFSVDLPEGNYLVTVVLGGKDHSVTSVKSESRRLMLETISTAPGQRLEQTFAVNVRNKYLQNGDSVRIKTREIGKLIWDDKLTLEFNGVHPSVSEIRVVAAPSLPTVFLSGDSTVVDEGNEPWAGWGQLLPAYLTPEVAVANYAESGLAANSFVSQRRLAKLLEQMKPGDYLIIQFGHNDQKQRGADKGPYASYTRDLKVLVDRVREKGGIPVLVPSMHRRRFDENGQIINTHGEYPDAVRKLAAEEGVYLVDLTPMSKTLYEAWGDEASKRAFVHYPAGTFPGQDQALADNTHFNYYGASQIAKCVVYGIVQGDLPLKAYVREGFTFDPAHPDDPDAFAVPATPSFSLDKPDGN